MQLPPIVRRFAVLLFIAQIAASIHSANAAPQLVTPQVPPAVQGQSYTSRILVGSDLALASASITGLPTGLNAAHDGAGGLLISGTPTVAGNFVLGVNAADTTAATLSGTVNLLVRAGVNTATQVSVGANHTCAVVAGGAQCWGANFNGQLGDGTTTERLLPVQVLGLSGNVTMISAGQANTCAVVDGGVQCWGWNNNGQLGDGTTTQRTTAVVVIPSGSGVTAVATDNAHTCAIVNGGVQCWGANSDGRLGTGNNTPSLTPVQVSGLGVGSGATAITTGSTHTCAIVSGSARCWGENFSGELGNGGGASSNVPVGVTGLASGVTFIDAGGRHSCAVVGGAAKCWGQNGSGRLGDGTTTDSNVPVQVSGLTSGVTAVAAAQNGSHSCALLSSGDVQCWGSGANGRLGNGGTSNSPQPTPVSGLTSGVTTIDAAVNHSCAVVNGGIQCWGTNGSGKLGNGSGNRSLTPMQVPGINTAFTSLAGGSFFTCGLFTGGSVKCWGQGTSGQLGNGASNDTNAPVQVVGLTSGVSAIASGANHACAINGGAALCWGTGLDGRLGNGGTASVNTPSQVTGITSAATAIASGEKHTCAVVNGGVQCWGLNDNGQLGTPTATLANSSTPVQVPALPAGSGVTALAGGVAYTCALVNGGVQCWGGNSDGQLGNGTNTASVSPVPVTGLTSGVTAIAGGLFHMCAVVSGGGVQCWGANSSGQLGRSNNTPSNVPVQVTGLTSGALSISLGLTHSCALVAGGVKCWGSNAIGQLGTGSGSSSDNAPVTAIAAGAGVSAMGAGYLHSCASINQSALACWGSNGNGGIADPFNGTALTPTAVVLQLTQTITFGGAPTLAQGGNGTVTATGGASGNPITFSTPSFGICTLGATTATSVVVNATGAGTCVIVADQASNATYAAGRAQLSIVIPKLAQTINFTSLGPISVTNGGTYVPAATGGGSNNPVVFSIASTSAASCFIEGNTVRFTGAGICTINANQAGNTNYDPAPQTSQAPFVNAGAAVLNFDGSSIATIYDAATDGVLLLRYLFGFRGAALTAGALGNSPTRDANQIEAHIAGNLTLLDVDGDGQTLALTDGVMILRRLLMPTLAHESAAMITANAKRGARLGANVISVIDALKP